MPKRFVSNWRRRSRGVRCSAGEMRVGEMVEIMQSMWENLVVAEVRAAVMEVGEVRSQGVGLWVGEGGEGGGFLWCVVVRRLGVVRRWVVRARPRGEVEPKRRMDLGVGEEGGREEGGRRGIGVVMRRILGREEGWGGWGYICRLKRCTLPICTYSLERADKMPRLRFKYSP